MMTWLPTGDIVAEVRIDHQEIIRSDDCCLLHLCGTMDGDCFAEKISVANDKTGRLAVILYVLGSVTYDSEGVEAVVRADGRVPRQVHMRPQPAPRPDRHAGWRR